MVARPLVCSPDSPGDREVTQYGPPAMSSKARSEDVHLFVVRLPRQRQIAHADVLALLPREDYARSDRPLD